MVLAPLVVTGTAWGKCGHGKKKGNPAVQQYVEPVPSVCGQKDRRAGNGTAPLPQRVEQELTQQGGGGSGGGRETGLLRKAATSERYGAPQHTRKIISDARSRKGREPAGRNPLAASVSAVSGGTDARLIALLVCMGVIVLVLAGFAAYRRPR